MKENRMAANTLTTRRKLLAAIPAAAVAAATAEAAFPATAGTPSVSTVSPELEAIIDAHRRAYGALVEAIRASGANDADTARANGDEEKALLAVCAFPARFEADRGAKARYLLEVEARGELDLPQHMRAVLAAMMA
jgi:hypothetical protein